MSPRGLTYHERVIPVILTINLHHYLENVCEFFPVSTGANSRLVAHFGYSYNYSSRGIHDPAPPIPGILQQLRDLIPVDVEFNQCIINRYLPGQGINAHIDRLTYGAHIACFTLGGGAELEFTRNGEIYRLYTDSRSLYIMTGEARYEWKHQMRARLSDLGHGARRTRYSVTFRTV